MLKRIAVDIGHGIGTGKGVKKGGVYHNEHIFNSAVGIELARLLKINEFQIFVLQEPNTTEFPLKKRIEYYNRQNVDLVWSIHADANSAVTAKGRYAFYWHTSKESKKLAQLYADEVKKAGYTTRGDGTQPSSMGNWTNLAICRDTRMPAVLSENGFMTNADDFKLIFENKQYPLDIAEIICKAICRYYGRSYTSSILPEKENDKYRPPPKPKIKYMIQTGAFRLRKNANDLVAELKTHGFTGKVKTVGDLFKVHIGPYAVKENAEVIAEELKQKGFRVYLVEKE